MARKWQTGRRRRPLRLGGNYDRFGPGSTFDQEWTQTEKTMKRSARFFAGVWVIMFLVVLAFIGLLGWAILSLVQFVIGG